MAKRVTMGPELLVPSGARLVHIGPPKTVTTTLQTALYDARPSLLAQGIQHVGRNRNPASAVQAVLGRRSQFEGGRVPSISQWRDLVREIDGAGERRVVVSSEHLANARQRDIERVVRDLGEDRLHVVVTLRPLARILPSQWQQYVQNGMCASLDDWLDAVLGERRTRLTPSFWRQHRHDRLVARWARVVGAQRVTVIVLDDRDRDAILRTFEHLLGLRAGTLEADPALANRSLTAPEVEAVRAFNVAFRANGLPDALLGRIMHFGAARIMKRQPPPSGAAPITLPPWAAARASELSRTIVDGIDGLDVRVVGDLAQLAPDPRAARGMAPMPASIDSGLIQAAEVSSAVSALLAMGVLMATGVATDQGAPPETATDGPDSRAVATPWAGVESPPMRRIPTPILAAALAARLHRAATRRLRMATTLAARAAGRIARAAGRTAARRRTVGPAGGADR